MTLDLNLGASFNAGAIVTPPIAPVIPDAFRIVSDDGNLVKVVNIESPLDKPCSIKVTNTRIANVYQTLAKNSVPSGNQASNTSGQSIFVELAVMASETVGSVEVLSPMIARLELRLPNNGSLTDSVVGDLINTLCALIRDEDGNLEVTSMMRGALFPAKQ